MKGVLLDDNYDLPDGKLKIGNVLYQNQALILVMQPGELKSSPATGVGIENMLLENDILYWQRLIRKQMELDGQKVKAVKINKSGAIDLDSKY